MSSFISVLQFCELEFKYKPKKNRRFCLFEIGCFVPLRNRLFCPTSKSAFLSPFRNRPVRLVFKMSCFVSFKIGGFVLPPYFYRVLICDRISIRLLWRYMKYDRIIIIFTYEATPLAITRGLSHKWNLYFDFWENMKFSWIIIFLRLNQSFSKNFSFSFRNIFTGSVLRVFPGEMMSPCWKCVLAEFDRFSKKFF